MPFKECRSWGPAGPVSKAFAGRYVALRTTNVDGRFDLCYRHRRLGQVDLAQPVT